MQLRHPNISVDLNIVPIWPNQFDKHSSSILIVKIIDNTKNHCSTLWQHKKMKVLSSTSIYPRDRRVKAFGVASDQKLGHTISDVLSSALSSQ